MTFTVNAAGTSGTLWHGTASTSAPMTTTWTNLVTIVPPTLQTFNGQLPLVAGYADLRADRAREIVAQMAVPYGFWASVVPLYRSRHPRTYEVLHLIIRLAKYAEMHFKNAFGAPRPHELSPQIQPMIPTPNHGAFPSGHSTEAHAGARVLFELVTKGTSTSPAAVQLREVLMRQAARIAINRTVAGMHYPVDSMAGQALGLAVADYFIRRCAASTAAGNVQAVTFDAGGTNYGAGQDFTGLEIYDPTNDSYVSPAPSYYARGANVSVPGSATLNWLWHEAELEW